MTPPHCSWKAHPHHLQQPCRESPGSPRWSPNTSISASPVPSTFTSDHFGCVPLQRNKTPSCLQGAPHLVRRMERRSMDRKCVDTCIATQVCRYIGMQVQACRYRQRAMLKPGNRCLVLFILATRWGPWTHELNQTQSQPSRSSCPVGRGTQTVMVQRLRAELCKLLRECGLPLPGGSGKSSQKRTHFC